MARSPTRPHDRNGFKIAVICALSFEADMVESMFDRFWDDDDGKSYGKVAGDQNAYTTGVIGNHNVVLAHMPSMGSTSAATVAQGLRTSFRGIEAAFVVGVCGVVPIHTETKEHIILGDCIISTAVVQYDFGRQHPQGFVMKNSIDSLGRASMEIRSLMSMLMTQRNRKRLTERLVYRLKLLQETRRDVDYPGVQYDLLFPPFYAHQHCQDGDHCDACSRGIGVCSSDCDLVGCESNQLVNRPRLQPLQTLLSDETSNAPPTVHFGRFGSANTVMKSGLDRDQIAEKSQLVAFEMEGSGVWDSFPTIVIKSACDYADSHKSKKWQRYAAATAAAGFKALLERWEAVDELCESDTKPTPSSKKPIYIIPFPNRRFLGREDKLQELEERLMIHKEYHQLAIYGLGGVGKTQLALAFCHLIKVKYSDYSIFWVSALSIARFKQDYLKIAKKYGISVDSGEDDVIHAVQEHLSNKIEKWLLIVDNSDDKTILFNKESKILNSLPQNEASIILFTTRYKDVAVELADGNVLNLGSMDVKEARELLVKSLGLGQDGLMQDEAVIEELLKDLEYLPLAIAQASSYIIRNSTTVSKYLQLMKDTKGEMVKLLSHGFRDSNQEQGSRNAVAVTWLASFELIKRDEPDAAEVLFFLASLENKSIPFSILPKTKTGSEGDMLHAIGTLISFSFLSNEEGDGAYSMHRLVHRAVKIWMQKEGILNHWKERVLLHLSQIFPTSDWANRSLWQNYIPHAVQVLQATETMPSSQRADLCLSLGYCLREDGRVREAIKWISECVHWRDQVLAEADSSRLSAQHALAIVYRSNGQIKDAITILETVVKIKEYLKETDPLSWHLSYYELALTYISNGKIKQCIDMLQQVASIPEEVLAADHPQRICSQHVLAQAYLRNAQSKQAIELLENIVTIRKRTLAEDHPDRLKANQDLARAYFLQGYDSKAVRMLEEVVTVRETILAEEHPDRLQSKYFLGVAYRLNGQVKESVETLENVVIIRERILEVDHPDRLSSQYQLASTYKLNGQVKEGIRILENVVAIEERALAEDHPDRLSTLDELANLYTLEGRVEEAIALMEKVVAIGAGTLTGDHPHQLGSQVRLADAYLLNGQAKMAIDVLEKVAAADRRVLAENHPDRLSTQRKLAKAYLENGQI